MKIRMMLAAMLAIGLALGLVATAQTQSEASGTLSMTMQPYQPNPELADDYRCFLVDPGTTEDIFVTAFNVIPDEIEIVHHAILYVVEADEVAQAQAVDASHSGTGWNCFGGPGVPGASGLSGALGTWVPGLTNTTFPEGTAKIFEAGSQIILQMHYNLAGISEVNPDESRIELTTSADSNLDRLRGMTLLSPVELKCPGAYPSDPADPCHREHALDTSLDGGVTNAALHARCFTQPQVYLGINVGDGSSQQMSCTTRINRTGQFLGALGHMHLRGSTLRVTLHPGEPEEQLVLYIPRWNFNLQEQIWFDQPIEFAAGDRIVIECTYDNSGSIPGPDGSLLEPRYTIWGDGTTDEMCLAWLQWIAS